MQAYVLLSLIYLAVYRLSKRCMTSVKITTAVITVLSLLLYLLPVASDAEKFYYLPFRTFEIMIGSMIAFMPKKKIKRVSTLPKGFVQHYLNITVRQGSSANIRFLYKYPKLYGKILVDNLT